MRTMIEYIKNNQKKYIDLIKTITKIPAPSHKEDRRVEFLLDYLHKMGYQQAYTDLNKNVIVEQMNGENEKIYLYTAHIDTVFPDEEPLEVEEDQEKIYGPGVGDDTTNVAAVLMWLEYALKEKIKSKKNIVFVLNSCEEGLGNLDGAKALWETYKEKIVQHVSFDGGYDWLVNRAVGSYRYQITVLTKGGHSYGNFGNANAIAYASKIICGLYQLKVDDLKDKTTYNVGTIQGGTSINTIAQEASFLFEFRSDQELSLIEMKKRVEEKISESLNCNNQQVSLKNGFEIELDEVSLKIELLGVRPGMGHVSEESLNELTNKAKRIIYEETGILAQEESGSTDCNVFLSHQVPSLCFGVYEGGGEHTREEFVWKRSLEPGLRTVFRFLMEEYHDK